MAVGLLEVRLRLYGTKTLKDKRSVLAGLLACARRDFNVSAALLDRGDDPGTAVLGFAHLSNNGRYSDRVLMNLLRRLEGARDCLVEDYEFHIL